MTTKSPLLKSLESIAEFIISARFHARQGSTTAALVDAEAAFHRLRSLLATHHIPEKEQQTYLAPTAENATQTSLSCSMTMTAKTLIGILNTFAPETDILVQDKTDIFNIAGCYKGTTVYIDRETGERVKKQVLVIDADETPLL